MNSLGIHEIKLLLQRQLGDGLVAVVGSGLSCAEGLPSMNDLAGYLLAKVGTGLCPEDRVLWGKIAPLIKKEGLESALLSIGPTQNLEAVIAAFTIELILKAEKKVVQEVFEGKRSLRFSRLVQHLLKPPSGLPIVTTNYDRLIEIACEEAGLGVDTLFVGSIAGELNEYESRMSFLRDAKLQRGQVRYHFRERANVFKPHGSLDWYQRSGKPVRFSGDLTSTRLVITPGLNKFRNGYESPFDRHRERANRAIDSAGRFLIIGYGFNDDHLQTHLIPMIKGGKPALILSHTLSPNASKLVKECPSLIAIEHAEVAGAPGTRLFHAGQIHDFGGLSLWDLNDFVSEVLEP